MRAKASFFCLNGCHVLGCLLAFCLWMAGCGGERLGYDSDGDGLSDKQESFFCTDPFNPDTDGDTIPDAIDESPCKHLWFQMMSQLAEVQSEESLARARLRVSVKNGAGAFVGHLRLSAETSFGQLGEIESLGTGLYEVWLESDSDGVALVTFAVFGDEKASQAETLLRVELKLKPKETVEKPTDPDIIDPANVVLEVPGLNPGRYADAGPLTEDLWVMAIAGESIEGGALAGVHRAYVQVNLSDGSVLTGWTNEEGWIRFEDPRLRGGVTLTVGAANSRYTTYFDMDSRIVSVGIVPRDVTVAEASRLGGNIHGVVLGFGGEGGLEAFPRENLNPLGKVNLAIVQVALQNTPLSSMNTGSILLPPEGDSLMTSVFSIPPNMVLGISPESARFRLTRLVPGRYVVFALAGVGSNLLEATQNPYRLKFEPWALGVQEVEVRAGEVVETEIVLDISLRTGVDTGDVHLGQFVTDHETSKPLSTGLVLPMIDTGRGVIFIDVATQYNFEDFRNPVRVAYPKPGTGGLGRLGLEARPMVVGLSGRSAVSGFDRPGISTLIAHPERLVSGRVESVSMHQSGQWLDLPRGAVPRPPEDKAFDAVGGALQGGEIVWHVPKEADLTILRFNYLVPPVRNLVLNCDIGASQSHLLWEVYVPMPRQRIELPALTPSAPDYPVLRNPEPTGPGATYQYGARTIELEINAYRMGPRSFDYRRNFLWEDVNMNASAVSQDSYLIHVP
ncbi:MAG: thrombospondin type 3 repeat-containing protein [Proteobacteria bacterium]|nr:thrombospondin type 3 repeat-containing protein [Pseudomonadota bacterium]